MRSMTAFAEVVRPLAAGQLRLTLRSVNHKALDLSLRLPPALFALETGLRAQVRETASRGKLDLTVEVQDDPSLEPRLNRALLRALAKGWQEDAEWLELPPMTAEAFFRVPGAFQAPDPDLAERLEAPVREAMAALLEIWNAGRIREAERLRPFFEDGLARLQSLRERLEAEADQQAAELPGLYRQRIEQLLEDARLAGQLPAERLLAEAGVLAERQDVREELTRLAAHLDDFAERLASDRLEGKAIDVWCQEVLRELNTTGSKCKRIAMTRAVMEAKGALDQIREQSANLE
ncbi:YicC family protein [Geothrix fermentans]|uniref:YicC family protein n=1 Tax=Geothrix fermentans TaxID=44676 RepID=UPI0004012DFE|nr:DUF1732 domain-containing protein [Geothrix fermentans]